MKIKHFLAFIFVAFLAGAFSQAQIHPRTDTLFIPETPVIPDIDANIEDVWYAVEWSPIDQIWMPWNNESGNLGQGDGLQLWSGANDFTGNFKVLWSSETNLMYFLVEITDDAFVDGYAFPAGEYPNYDIVEIFIDEDRSGGLHVFDGTGSVATSWGTNAENAFSYHMAVNAAEDGVVQNELHVLDIAGTNWGANQKIMDYVDHFPEFAMKKEGDKYIWEFSLIVHNDSYDHDNQEASIVILEERKIMGLSMAYCDNDDPNENPVKRDHFFGSVDVPLTAHNDHWKDADWFGVAKLMPVNTTSAHETAISDNYRWNIFAADGFLNTRLNHPKTGTVHMRVLSITGAEVFRFNATKSNETFQQTFSLNGLQSGIYLVEVILGDYRKTEKILVR